MDCENKLFAELFGFAIFDLRDLQNFKSVHQLGDDLLEAFTTLEVGNQATEQGVVIPIIGINGDYYCLSVLLDKMQESRIVTNSITVHSDGWILHSSTGEITICGIGYLKKFNKNFEREAKYLKFMIPPGWHKIAIVGGLDIEANMSYELYITSVNERPMFSGNIEDNFAI